MFWLNMLSLSVWLLSKPPQAVTVYTDPASVLHPVQATATLPMPMPTPDTPLFAPMPVGAVQANADYLVDLRVVDAPRTIHKGMQTQFLAPLNRNQLEPISSFSSSCGTVKLEAALRNLQGPQADLELRLTCLTPSGEQVGSAYRGKRSVTFHQPTKVTLVNDGPEPCSVEVTVREQPTKPTVDQMVWTVPRGASAAPECCAAGAPVAVPCSPYPVGPMVAPMVAPLPEPMPVAMSTTPIPYGAAMPRMPRNTHLSIVKDGEKSRVQMKSEAGSLTCGVSTLEGRETGKVRVAPGKKQVLVRGNRWKAQADQIDLRDDGVVVLKGNVKLTSDRLGVEASVSAKELRVQLRHGQFERILEQPTPIRVWSASPTTLRPVQYLQSR